MRKVQISVSPGGKRLSRHSLRVSFPSGLLKLAGILEQPTVEAKGSILFSHCFTCNKDLKAIVRIGRALAELGWNVLRYDFRGLGNSEGNFSQSNFHTNCEDLQAAAAYLASTLGGPHFLLGHSFGGAASLASAMSIESVRGVMTLAAPSDTHHLANLLERMDPKISSEGKGSVTIGGFRYEIEHQMLSDFRSHDLPTSLKSLDKPILAFHSPADETVSYEHAMRICGFGNLNEQRKQRSLITLPGSNHLLTNESDCRWVANLMNAWCTGI